MDSDVTSPKPKIKRKRSLKTFLSISEKIVFIVLAVVLIIIANGIKYDPQKKEFVQTGVLRIEGIEENTTISFNNNVYQNKDNLSVSLLDENNYSLKIIKTGRQEYSTVVPIKKGEITYVNPVLIPTLIKPTLMKTATSNVQTSDQAIFYTYTEAGNTYLERLSINKSLFGLDTTRSRVKLDLAGLTDFVITPSINQNLVIINSSSKLLLADMNNQVVYDISTNLPQDKIKSVEFNNDSILIKYDSALYSINISDPKRTQRNVIFTGKDFVFGINDNNNITLGYFIDGTTLKVETYNSNGVIQSNSTIKSNFDKSPIPSKLFIFNKDTYIKIDQTIYRVNSSSQTLENIDQNIQDVQVIDRDTVVLIGDNKVTLLNKDKQFEGKIASFATDVHFLTDSFTFYYVDKDMKLHLADLGGQDNVIVENAGPKFILAQNGSDNNLIYSTGTDIDLIKFGNDKN